MSEWKLLMPFDVKTQIIISDTSCLIALTNIGLLGVLQNLYETVLATPEVAGEYGEPLPEWISIRTVIDTAKINAFIENPEPHTPKPQFPIPCTLFPKTQTGNCNTGSFV